jgi:hypothetical protein
MKTRQITDTVDYTEVVFDGNQYLLQWHENVIACFNNESDAIQAFNKRIGRETEIDQELVDDLVSDLVSQHQDLIDAYHTAEQEWEDAKHNYRLFKNGAHYSDKVMEILGELHGECNYRLGCIDVKANRIHNMLQDECRYLGDEQAEIVKDAFWAVVFKNEE